MLYRPDEPIDDIYFPETAIICMLTVMHNGDTIETSTVGFEGASWVSASVGARSMPCETIVAIAGDALLLSAEDLDEEMKQNAHFRDVLTEYSHALLIHSLRLTGCTGLHTLRQRCARWILTTLDRIGDNRFVVTHEFLASLLGVTRPSVSTVVEDFNKSGALRVEQGRVIVADRERLRAATCECYEVIKQNYLQVGH